MPFSVFCYLTSNPWLAFWVMIVPNMLGSYWLAPVFSLTQGLVGLRMRAVAASIMLFVLNLIGMGLGPGFVGVVSDLLHAYTQLGVDSLRWSLVTLAGLRVRRDLLLHSRCTHAEDRPCAR